MGKTTRAAAMLGLCLAASLPMAGCKGKLSKGTIEKQLQDDLEKQSGLRPKSVECPSDLAKKSGATMECKLTAPDGSTRQVSVTMSDDKGGYHWEVIAPQGGPAPVAAAPEFLTIPNSQVQIQAPVGWKRKQDDDWGLLVSPDDKAVLAFVAFNRPNESTARIGQIARVLHASTVSWGSPKRGVVGPDQMPANVADGSCLFNGRDSSISYATVNPGGSTQILVVYATNNDVPADVKKQGVDTFASIRRKR